MDRSNIEKITQDPQQRMLLAKLWDKIQGGIRRNIPAHTGFLSPQEQELARFLFGNEPGLVFFGGYADAERRMLCWLPEYLSEESLWEESSPVKCIHCNFYAGDSPTHRDFLGSLMGCGIARETLGDISVGQEEAFLFVTEEIAPYILQTLTGAGRTKVSTEQIALSQADIQQPAVKEIRDTVSSLRLDSILCAGFRISRSLACSAIAAGKASINGLPCEKSDKAVAQGDKISLRGYGKILLHQLNGQTRKGRISVVIHRYV